MDKQNSENEEYEAVKNQTAGEESCRSESENTVCENKQYSDLSVGGAECASAEDIGTSPDGDEEREKVAEELHETVKNMIRNQMSYIFGFNFDDFKSEDEDDEDDDDYDDDESFDESLDLEDESDGVEALSYPSVKKEKSSRLLETPADYFVVGALGAAAAIGLVMLADD